MKRIIRFFLAKNILIQACLIKKSGGGIIPWQQLKLQIEEHLFEPNVIVTTFIDYYGIAAKHEFPNWQASLKYLVKSDRMDFLESAMKTTIKETMNRRFIPYIQLHEFEGLLFNNIEVFTNNFAEKELNKEEILKILAAFPNSENINDGKTTAPSKRLKNIISGYNKVIYGNIIAEEIGLQKIRSKNPRFNQWLERLLAV